MLEREDKNLKTLAFFREIENMPLKSANEYIQDFSEENDITKELVKKLKDDTKRHLNEKNQSIFQVRLFNILKVFCNYLIIFIFQIDWNKADNLNDETIQNEHIKDYLKKFGEEFQIKVKDLVVSNMKINTTIRIDEEILHHASYCKKLNSKLNAENYDEKVFF
jgi:hypothetical protein